MTMPPGGIKALFAENSVMTIDVQVNRVAAVLERLKETELLHGTMSGSVSDSVRAFSATASKKHQELTAQQKKVAQQRMDDAILLDALDRRIADLQIQLDEEETKLRAIYGDDYVDDLAEMYLTDKELEGLNTDDEKLDGIAEKILDDKNQVKPEYAGQPGTRYISIWGNKEEAEHKKEWMLRENSNDSEIDDAAENSYAQVVDRDLGF